MKFLKFLVVILTLFGTSVFVYGYLSDQEIISTIASYYNKSPSVLVTNEYTKEIDNNFVKLTNNFYASNKQDLLDIYYTIISSGMNEFTFYCKDEYETCTSDAQAIFNDNELLSEINNFVNVYNTFKKLKVNITKSYFLKGRIDLVIEKVYSKEDIERIEKKLDELEPKLIDKNKSDYDNILNIHDYIINNTKYNIEDENKENTESSTAIGVLFNLATCNGYTDTASLLLDRLNIKNMRISNDNHIWNLVYLNNKWLHLDLTWDDPVNNLNQDMLLHDYFLKETKEMDDKHNFNKEIFDFIN